MSTEEYYQKLNEALAKDPNDTVALWHRSVALLRNGNLDAALVDLYNLLRLEPRNLEARNQIRFIHRKLVPTWHFDMMNDSVRNNAYAQAIKHAVKPGMTVFEIGCGSGLLSMLAVKAGASHVWTCEKSLPIRTAAREIIRKNGFSDKITLLDKWSTSVHVPKDIPAQVDLVIGEIFGAGLLEEQAIHFFNDARARILKPQGKILPARAIMYGALISSDEISSRAHVRDVCGFDMRVFNGLNDDPGMQINVKHFTHTFLSKPFEIQRLDFNAATPEQVESRIEVTPIAQGVCNGILQWFRLEFDGSVSFDTAPTSPRTHWDQYVQVLEKPIETVNGQSIAFLVRQFADRFSLYPLK